MIKRGKIVNLEGSEVDKLDNLGVAAAALIDAEIAESNKDSVVHRKENLEALRAVVQVLRRTFHDG